MSKQVPVDITVTKHGEVAVLKMSGTDNRINIIFCKKWIEAMDKVESWPDVKALVSTGSGKFYSNGLDLDFLNVCSKREADEYAVVFREMRRRLLCFPMVTIAAVSGHCFAGGLIIALLHDYRVMHNGRGWMCLNEVELGLRFPDSMRAIFELKFSPALTRDAAIFGYRYTAVQALDAGLIDELAPDGQAVPKAIEMAIVKTKGRTYRRQIVSEMKEDLYRRIVTADDMYPGGVGKEMFESKL